MDGLIDIPTVQLEIKNVMEKKVNVNGLENMDTTAEFFREYIGCLDRECVAVCCVNKGLEPICVQIVSVGTSNSCIFSIPEILKIVILSNSRGFFVAHNHPTGDLRVSKNDVESIQNLAIISKCLEIQLLDHFIVCPTKGAYFSFKGNDML